MTRTVLALGANLGDRAAALQAAVDRLAAVEGVTVVAVSPVYETAAVGGPPGQSDYLNAVLLAEVAASAHDLLQATQAIESALGRVRAERWGPRQIDIDIVAMGDLVVDDAELTVPHPRAASRAFVLRPWVDVDPDARLPDGRRVADLLSRVDARAVRQHGTLRLPATGPGR